MAGEVAILDRDPEGIAKTRGSVFTLIGFYLPGFKGGGPTRSVANLASALGSEFNFKVITLDRDYRATTPYPDIPSHKWVAYGHADVMYLKPGWDGLLKMLGLLRSMERHDVLYLNSFFSRRFSMLPILLKRLCLVRTRCIIVAPRGEFSPGALQIKKSRKRLYVSIARSLGFYRDVIWHASSPHEAEHIRGSFERAEKIRVAGVIPELPHGVGVSQVYLSSEHSERIGNAKHTKKSGQLKALFISRISPMKNLVGALSMIRGVSGSVIFHIYGPLEDVAYWEACKSEINSLPANVRVQYLGEVEHHRVSGIFAEYDLLFLPTLGENYGHVIFEALGAGCPVLISDRTPWRNLRDVGAGWDLPLGDMQAFHDALQYCIDADPQSYEELRTRAKLYAQSHRADPEIIAANRSLFREAVATALMIDR